MSCISACFLSIHILSLGPKMLEDCVLFQTSGHTAQMLTGKNKNHLDFFMLSVLELQAIKRPGVNGLLWKKSCINNFFG